jgi:hypothetical protein
MTRLSSIVRSITIIFTSGMMISLISSTHQEQRAVLKVPGVSEAIARRQIMDKEAGKVYSLEIMVRVK